MSSRPRFIPAHVGLETVNRSEVPLFRNVNVASVTVWTIVSSVHAEQSVEAAKTQFEGYTYLTAGEQAGDDYLGGKMAEDMLTTAKFLLDQGGITKVGTAQDYAGHVDAGPASRGSE